MTSPVRWPKLRVLRALERLLPVPILCAVIWPLAALQVSADLWRRRSAFKAFGNRPPSIQPTPNTGIRAALRFWRERVRLKTTLLAYYWPDRLRSKKWQRRCECIGFERLTRIVDSGQPVVLASLHVGPFWTVRAWFRARGIQTAALAGLWRAPHQEWLSDIGDEANGMVGIPSVYHPTHIRKLRQFLTGGRAAIVLVDTGKRRNVSVRESDFQFRMASGALRLASLFGARVVPCLIYASGTMRWTIHVFDAVPQELVENHQRHREASRQLMREFLPVLRGCSDQYSVMHINRFERLAKQPVASGALEPTSP